MQIKKIEFLDEVDDVNNDNIDVGVVFEDNHSYTILVRTPQNLLQEMKEEKTNFVEPGAPTIIVKKLTYEIVAEAVEAYLKLDDDGYWLKLCQFGDNIDISVFNKLDSQQRKLDSFIYGKRFDHAFQRYLNFSLEDIAFFETMLFLTILTLIVYYFLKPESFEFFSNFVK
uniref:hypothetical protein n=1 Tax=Navicula tsukamotoi TaxID=2018706 RepID=UPI0021824CA4|nr:hypothetical protein NDC64_pgp076 [Navicula tsukamotoi]UVG41732.1 hypothetical protein [Navicula tsukamotoi]UVG41876.1 hypothetical protein [Navicula tsukamotoi]